MSGSTIKQSMLSAMGAGVPLHTTISSLTLAIIILFFSVSVPSYFEPDVYRFDDRVTYHQYFQDRHILTSLADNLFINLSLFGWIHFSFVGRLGWIILFLFVIAVGAGFASNLPINEIVSIISLPFVFAALLLNKLSHWNILRPNSTIMTVRYLSLIFLILSLISIYISLSNSDLNDPFVDIMTFLSRYTPIIMVFLIFVFFLRLILNQILLSSSRNLRVSIISFIKPFDIPQHRVSKKLEIIALGPMLAASVFIVLIPHLDGFQQRVAEDTTIYADWIEDLSQSKGLDQFLRVAFIEIHFGDRPLSMLIMFFIASIFNTTVALEVILLACLAPILVLVTYFLTKELSSSTISALCASFIVVVSFQLMIGVYAGFYATWIALVVGYISLIFMLRFLKTGRRTNLICFSISMVILLLCHIYTWTIVTIFLLMFLSVLRWKKLYPSKYIYALIAIALSIVALDLVKSSLIGSSSGIQSDLVIAEKLDFGIYQFEAKWSVIVRTVVVFLGGIFGNIIILLLALYGAIMIRNRNIVTLIFIIVFLSLGIAPLYFGDKIVQSRVLYDIPFQIPAGIALANIFVSRNGRLFVTVIASSLFAITIYIMTNLGEAPR